jgi:MFS family permease
MDYHKALRYVDLVVASSKIAISVAGLIGIGILFDHYARRASSWVDYPILLGYISFLGGVMYGTVGVNKKKSRGSHRILWPTIVFVAAATALILGLFVPRVAAYMSSWAEEYCVVLGLLLIMAAALSGTITFASLAWRQWRDERALKERTWDWPREAVW